MTLYSLENAQYLKEYYSPKVINKIADESTALRITSIEIDEIKKDLYDLICSGYFVTIPMKVNTLFRPKWTVVLMMISWVKIRQNYLLLFHFFSHGFSLQFKADC